MLAWTSDLLRWLAVVVLMGATYALLYELLQFPVSLGRYYQNRAWGMTDQPIDDWLRQHLLAVGVGLTAEAIGGVGLYLLLRWFARTWYALGTVGAVGLAFAVAFLMPVVIAPLFNTFTPLSETEWAALEPRLRHLAEQAGIPVEGIYVADASRQGKHTNAYFTGLGATQSIVLYDTLLKQHPPAEVELILAHEIGHWKHHHIIQGILLGGLAALVGLIVLDRAALVHGPAAVVPARAGRPGRPAVDPAARLPRRLGGDAAGERSEPALRTAGGRDVARAGGDARGVHQGGNAARR